MSTKILAFQIDDRRYGLHLARVERVVRAVDATPLPQAPEIVWGAISLRGMIVPVLNMRQRLGFPERDIGLDDHFIIAKTARQTVALVVDNAVGVIERASEEIVAARRILRHMEQIEGVIQLDEGLLLIHDLDRFLSLDEERELELALTRTPEHGK